jgi:probable rRNA maturation factor
MTVEINNLTTVPIKENFLKKAAEKVLTKEKGKKLELSVALVGQSRMKELNKKYRRKNRATDVLSFAYDNSGEVVICLPEVKKNARIFNSKFEKELTKALIHGILHLMGYDHEKGEKQAKETNRKEDYYLNRLNF